MAKNREKQSDDENQTAEPLSPEQRIERLEKQRATSLIIIGVLFFVMLIQLGLLSYSLISSDSRQAPDNSEELTELREDIRRLQVAFKKAESFYLQNQILESKLDRALNDVSMNNFATLRNLLQGQEENYVQFTKALQLGMYELSRMVRGSRTWFEVYKEELDAILSDSSQRLRTLQGIKPLPPRSE